MLRSTSASVVAHDDTLTRIAARPRQLVGPHQHVPSAATRARTSRLRASSPNDTTKAMATITLLVILLPWMLRTGIEFAAAVIGRMPEMVR